MDTSTPKKFKHGYQPIDFDVVKTPMVFRIAIMAVVTIFGVIAIAGNVRTAVNQSKTAQTTPVPAQTNQTTETPNTATTNTAGVTKPQTSTTTQTSQSKVCNTTLKNSYTAEYNSQIEQENARHANQLKLLTATGAPASAFAAEDRTHAATLNSIAAQYQANLRSINC